MSKSAHFRKLEHVFSSSPVNEHFDTTLKVSEGYAEVTIKMGPDLLHGGGVAHGSVYFVRPVSDGTIMATGCVVHQARRLLILEAEAVDSQGRQVTRESGTFMRSRVRKQ